MPFENGDLDLQTRINQTLCEPGNERPGPKTGAAGSSGPNIPNGYIAASTHSKGSSAKADGSPKTTKVCVRCGTAKTPMWRNGPEGPKTLCNACGVRLARAQKAQARNASKDHSSHASPRKQATGAGASHVEAAVPGRRAAGSRAGTLRALKAQANVTEHNRDAESRDASSAHEVRDGGGMKDAVEAGALTQGSNAPQSQHAPHTRSMQAIKTKVVGPAVAGRPPAGRNARMEQHQQLFEANSTGPIDLLLQQGSKREIIHNVKVVLEPCTMSSGQHGSAPGSFYVLTIFGSGGTRLVSSCQSNCSLVAHYDSSTQMLVWDSNEGWSLVFAIPSDWAAFKQLLASRFAKAVPGQQPRQQVMQQMDVPQGHPARKLAPPAASGMAQSGGAGHLPEGWMRMQWRMDLQWLEDFNATRLGERRGSLPSPGATATSSKGSTNNLLSSTKGAAPEDLLLQQELRGDSTGSNHNLMSQAHLPGLDEGDHSMDSDLSWNNLPHASAREPLAPTVFLHLLCYFDQAARTSGAADRALGPTAVDKLMMAETWAPGRDVCMAVLEHWVRRTSELRLPPGTPGLWDSVARLYAQVPKPAPAKAAELPAALLQPPGVRPPPPAAASATADVPRQDSGSGDLADLLFELVGDGDLPDFPPPPPQSAAQTREGPPLQPAAAAAPRVAAHHPAPLGTMQQWPGMGMAAVSAGQGRSAPVAVGGAPAEIPVLGKRRSSVGQTGFLSHHGHGDAQHLAPLHASHSASLLPAPGGSMPQAAGMQPPKRALSMPAVAPAGAAGAADKPALPSVLTSCSRSASSSLLEGVDEGLLVPAPDDSFLYSGFLPEAEPGRTALLGGDGNASMVRCESLLGASLLSQPGELSELPMLSDTLSMDACKDTLRMPMTMPPISQRPDAVAKDLARHRADPSVAIPPGPPGHGGPLSPFGRQPPGAAMDAVANWAVGLQPHGLSCGPGPAPQLHAPAAAAAAAAAAAGHLPRLIPGGLPHAAGLPPGVQPLLHAASPKRRCGAAVEPRSGVPVLSPQAYGAVASSSPAPQVPMTSTPHSRPVAAAAARQGGRAAGWAAPWLSGGAPTQMPMPVPQPAAGYKQYPPGGLAVPSQATHAQSLC